MAVIIVVDDAEAGMEAMSEKFKEEGGELYVPST